MKKLSIIMFAFTITMLACKQEHPDSEFKPIQVKYPHTKQDTIVEDYFGQKIPDPYRWLEDDNSPETKAWVVEENKVTDEYLSQIPFQENIRKRLEKIWNYEKYSSPFKEGDYYYYFKNDGLQNQSVLYQSQGIKDEGTVFIDPNKFSEDGTTSLGGMEFNNDGKYLAYAISEGGSDWRKVFVMDVNTKELLNDKLEWVKFSSLAWRQDGFYYSRYPQPKGGDELSSKNEFHSLYYHKLGTSQADDQLIYVDKENPLRNVYATTSEDERFVIISTSESTSGNGLYFIDTEKDANKIVPVITDFNNDYNFIDNEGDELLVLTNDNAPLERLVMINTNNPSKETWTDIIPESKDALKGISLVGGKIFANYIHDASSLIKVFDSKGKFIQDLALPGIGTSGGVNGKKSDDTGFYSFTSFIRPNTIYSLNAENLNSEVFREPKVDFDSDAYETKQVWYSSKDGTKVPMFLTMKKGLKIDGERPTLLYGYGGFDISILPSFSISRLPILENDGIYAVANIRGGGEFGKEWHEAGTKERKQNVFDDFIAAAEKLIADGYTSSDRLAIQGGSNGGLLVGACMTQRPDLFKVAFPAVGVLDMLRYHKFTIGWAWAGDYGKSEDEEAFNYLIKYSPLQNIKPEKYPATLVTTADHDDRVVPAHSFKFIAELQKNQQGTNPTLIRIETSAGHGAGKPTSKQIEEAADILSFMFFNMNVRYPE
ncbi:MAG TPA: prolyl oligopeptidase family serine peptidase [Saprospiraceae bacterium]|nr:S9 family peptidase [Lewinellaceae bacterium]HRX29264.1 prolyl oligopeptidase family serine peptidase [Saprospiraceae bacterium]